MKNRGASAAGVTLVELVVTMVVVGVAVGFIAAAYVIAMRTWTVNGNALENIRVASRLRGRVHRRLACCTQIIPRTPRSWLLVNEPADTARMEYRAGKLRVRDSLMNVDCELKAFTLATGSPRGHVPVVDVAMVVWSHGVASELAWRLPCRGDEALPDRAPRPHAVPREAAAGLYWER